MAKKEDAATLVLRFYGEEWAKKLNKKDTADRLLWCEETVSQNHRACVATWRRALQHAREAGQALIEAKWRLGHRTKWSRWRKATFPDISRETCIHYMRVARHWDDERLVAARQGGFKIESIRGFLKFLQGRPITPAKPKQTARRDLGQIFARYLKERKPDELRMLEFMFGSYLLPAMHSELRKWVLAEDADAYEPWELEQELDDKRVARGKVARALSKRTASH